MYTYCTIQFIDDGTIYEVIIKAYDSEDEYDELIFFYGLSKERLENACSSGEIFENEWRVLSVDGVTDKLS